MDNKHIFPLMTHTCSTNIQNLYLAIKVNLSVFITELLHKDLSLFIKM